MANSTLAWVSRSGVILQVFKKLRNGSLSACQAFAASRQRAGGFSPSSSDRPGSAPVPVQDAGEFGAQFVGVHFILGERRRVL